MATVHQILDFLGDTCETRLLADGAEDLTVDLAAPLGQAGPGSVAFANTARRRKAAALADARPTVLIVGPDAPDPTELASRGIACVVVAQNPRLTFARVAERFLARPRPAAGIHPTAVVSPEATMGRAAHVGAGCALGSIRMGDDCVLHPGVVLYDGVTLGSRVQIHANTVAGADGFGFERDADGRPTKFPQMAGVTVGDDVEIGACSCVDRGALCDTTIGDRVKLDNHVHVAHNVRIGNDTLIAAGAVIAGSAVLGEQVWVGPAACVSSGITVGDGAKISLGAVVVRDVDPGQTVTGNFAVDHAAFLRSLRSTRG